MMQDASLWQITTPSFKIQGRICLTGVKNNPFWHFSLDKIQENFRVAPWLYSGPNISIKIQKCSKINYLGGFCEVA